LQQTPEQRGGHTKRRIGDDVVGPPGQPKRRRVGLHDDDRRAELPPKELGAFTMGLDGDDPGTGLD
jgi:hypothetical protein